MKQAADDLPLGSTGTPGPGGIEKTTLQQRYYIEADHAFVMPVRNAQTFPTPLCSLTWTRIPALHSHICSCATTSSTGRRRLSRPRRSHMGRVWGDCLPVSRTWC
jgi:hypothetical protein